ncbi:MAG: family 78 glycoside hydrolase catalytic domain [Clostridia bacterium]|nr:family 78 glycoside hydrolase catalytic domain [Clostridia bacterium]
MKNAKWIKPKRDYGDICPEYRYRFECNKQIKSAALEITAMGVYEAHMNGSRIGDFILAPGWTVYHKRHQYQTYDITHLIQASNEITVTVGKGWYRGGFLTWRDKNFWGAVPGLIAAINLIYADGTEETITTDRQWLSRESSIRFAEIYDGEIYDASFQSEEWEHTSYHFSPVDNLIPQEGEIVCEHEQIKPVEVITTPKGERVIDFGQNMTGYVEFDIEGKSGDRVVYTHAEILDAEGNFYTENLRSAKQRIEYICRDGFQTYKPHHTFMGFRYIRIDEAPDYIDTDAFRVIVVHSDIRRTGHFECSNEKVNKLYSNILWGQRDNFLDIPTDCPQRDERLGWTGDAQVFVKTASYNYDINRFFVKWLKDLAVEQRSNGAVPDIVPDIIQDMPVTSGWGDAATICPWQIYLTYGDKTVLENQIDSMTAWVEYIHSRGEEEYLWVGEDQMGDWLGLDAPEGTYKGSSDTDLIASAYFARSTEILAKALKVLGKDSTYYENMHREIVCAFQRRFKEYKTQTECAISLVFNLAQNKSETAAKLADMVRSNGNKLTTGFLGTPYIMEALSENGYTDVAYSLLLQEEYPSWLFSVNMGATTVWEHWDSLKADGSMWSTRMNSFNHYAYGCVGAWMYETVCGIRIDEDLPGFERVIICPKPDERLRWARASVDTRFGTIKSGWTYTDGEIVYEFELPVPALVEIGDRQFELNAGKHTYRSN